MTAPKSPSPTVPSSGTSTTQSFRVSELYYDDKIGSMLKEMGYKNRVKVANALQGSIWRALKISTSTTAVFKIAIRSLHDESSGMIDDKIYAVQENICLEQSILKYICMQIDCPKSIVKWNGFFKTDTHYWLVMEDGGVPLFEFIQTIHVLISSGRLSIDEWKKVMKVIFNQMVECIDFIHSHNVCHNDVSLENFVMNDVEITVDNRSNIQIKLCDFGLATLFPRNECFSNKHCGKRQYKSPEVIRKKSWFSAKKNDVWCVGICLFMMSTGYGPWDKADESQSAFVYIMNGYLCHVLKVWGVTKYVDTDLADLFERIFQYEEKRISVDEIKNHPFVK